MIITNENRPNWINGDTPVDADDLNNIVDTAIDSHQTSTAAETKSNTAISEVTRLESLIVAGGTVVSVGGVAQTTFNADTKLDVSEYIKFMRWFLIGNKTIHQCSPIELIRVRQSGLWNDLFGENADINITLLTGEVLTFNIWGDNHDDLSDGSGKAPITLGMKNLMATTRQTNSLASNAGGWNNSQLRAWLNNDLFALLPIEWQSAIKTVDKLTANGGSQTGTTLVISQDRIFAPSQYELTGINDVNVMANEGTQYEYWSIRNTNANRIKSLSNGIGGASPWRVRSPHAVNTTGFRHVNIAGAMSWSSSSDFSGICFVFCI